MVLSIRQDVGRVIVMLNGCQKRFKHGMPPEDRDQPKSFTVDPYYHSRINWTMRCVRTDAKAGKTKTKRKRKVAESVHDSSGSDTNDSSAKRVKLTIDLDKIQDNVQRSTRSASSQNPEDRSTRPASFQEQTQNMIDNIPDVRKVVI
jgi:hypothetical protein